MRRKEKEGQKGRKEEENESMRDRDKQLTVRSDRQDKQ